MVENNSLAASMDASYLIKCTVLFNPHDQNCYDAIGETKVDHVDTLFQNLDIASTAFEHGGLKDLVQRDTMKYEETADQTNHNNLHVANKLLDQLRF